MHCVFLIDLLSSYLPTMSPCPAPFTKNKGLGKRPTKRFFGPFENRPIPEGALEKELYRLISTSSTNTKWGLYKACIKFNSQNNNAMF